MNIKNKKKQKSKKRPPIEIKELIKAYKHSKRLPNQRFKKPLKKAFTNNLAMIASYAKMFLKTNLILNRYSPNLTQ